MLLDLCSLRRAGMWPFGWDELPDIDTRCANIKTYTEQIEESEHLSGIREAMATAQTIVFLGNAYHPNNMKLLTPDQSWQLAKASKILKIRRGIISSEDLDIVGQRLGQFHRPIASSSERKVSIASTHCFDLFQNFRWSIHDLTACPGDSRFTIQETKQKPQSQRRQPPRQLHCHSSSECSESNSPAPARETHAIRADRYQRSTVPPLPPARRADA